MPSQRRLIHVIAISGAGQSYHLATLRPLAAGSARRDFFLAPQAASSTPPHRLGPPVAVSLSPRSGAPSVEKCPRSAPPRTPRSRGRGKRLRSLGGGPLAANSARRNSPGTFRGHSYFESYVEECPRHRDAGEECPRPAPPRMPRSGGRGKRLRSLGGGPLASSLALRCTRKAALSLTSPPSSGCCSGNRERSQRSDLRAGTPAPRT